MVRLPLEWTTRVVEMMRRRASRVFLVVLMGRGAASSVVCLLNWAIGVILSLGRAPREVWPGWTGLGRVVGVGGGAVGIGIRRVRGRAVSGGVARVGGRAMRSVVMILGYGAFGCGVVRVRNWTAWEVWMVERTGREVLILIGVWLGLACEGVVDITEMWRGQSFLFLATVAEPHPDNFLLELEGISKDAKLCRRRFWILAKALLEGSLDGHLYAGAFLPFSSLSGHFVYAGERSRGTVSLLEPFGQQRFQLAHVFEAELKRLKAADCCLREDIAIKGS